MSYRTNRRTKNVFMMRSGPKKFSKIESQYGLYTAYFDQVRDARSKKKLREIRSRILKDHRMESDTIGRENLLTMISFDLGEYGK